MSDGRVSGRRRRPSPQAVLVALAAALLSAALLYASFGVDVTRDVNRTRLTEAETANADHAVLTLQTRLLVLAAAAAASRDDPAARERIDALVGEVRMRRGLALRHLWVLDGRAAADRLGEPALTREALAAQMRTVREVDPAAVVRDPGGIGRIDARLTAVARQLKAAHDANGIAFQRLTNRAVAARRTTQWAVGGMALLTLVTGGVWLRRARARSRGEVRDAFRAVRAGEERFRSLVQNSSDLTLLADADGTIAYASPAARALLGIAPEQIAGRVLTSLVHEEDRAALVAALRRLSAGGTGRLQLEFRALHSDGSVRHLDATVSDMLADPTVAGLVLNIRDVTDRHRLAAELSHLAFHDPLTGLPNRTLLRERIAHAHARAARHAADVALILIDLDDFKAVNDSLGHMAGDRMLVAIAHRLNETVRPGDTVARLGGDEFVVFAEDLEDEAAAGRLADLILEGLSAPLPDEPALPPTTASLGIRFAAARDVDPEHLLRDADLAMYAAKARGKGCWALFEPGMHDTASAQLTLRADLHQALERAELTLRFEPWVDLATGRIVGFEALVRWRHPREGLLPPAAFIPLAEDTGLVNRLGAWVVGEATAAIRRLQVASGRRDLTLGVNLSPRQLADDGLVDVVRDALDRAGLPPDQLVLEVTESAFLAETSAVAACVSRLRGLGVRLALDDFGTGFSSLGYLERLPLDVLKIDRSFVSSLGDTESRSILVATIVRLGDVLGLRTVAEGVETTEQLSTLRTLGCAHGQGYLFSPPVPEDGALMLLRRGSLPPSRGRERPADHDPTPDPHPPGPPGAAHAIAADGRQRGDNPPHPSR